MKIAFRLLACGLVLAFVGCAAPTDTKDDDKDDGDDTPALVAGLTVFSETDRTATVDGLIGGGAADQGGWSTDLTSIAFAKEGTTSVALNPGLGAWGGGFLQFTPVDVSGYTSLVFSINTTGLQAAPTSMEIKLEAGDIGNSMQLIGQPSVVEGDWTTYTVPLAQFTAGVGIGYANAALPDLTAIKSIGLWNMGTYGVLYLDDVHFE